MNEEWTPEEDPELSWKADALCAQTDPEAFFPEKGGSTRAAKAVCASCDVRSQCLEYALVHGERFGIWGGLSERERRKLLKGTYRPAEPRTRPLRHGTRAGYARGCRDGVTCPGDAAGVSCADAYREYQARWRARRRAGGEAA